MTVTTHKTSGDTVIADYVYTRLADSKISRVVESNAGGQVSQTDYDYDELGRLKQEAYNGVAAGGDYTIDYSLDLVGNRLAKETSFENGDVQLVSSAYNLRDWLTSEETRLNGNLTDTATYGYDANGSLTTRSSTSGDSATYTWDLRNRLASASVTTGGQTNTSSYVYDDSGIEVCRTENGTTRLLLVDSLNPTGYAQVIEELESGLLVASYVYGLEPLSQSQNGQVSHYLLDGHSGVRQLLDAAGAVLNAYRYDAFGTLLAQTGNAVNPVLYRGERFDPVLGQYYLRARFYDPARGRFTRMDPFAGTYQIPAEFNRYAFGGINPISNRDPSGMSFLTSMTTAQFIMFSAKIGAAIGALGGAAYAHFVLGFSPLQWQFWAWTIGGAVVGAAIGATIGWGLVKFGIVVTASSPLYGTPQGQQQLQAWFTRAQDLSKNAEQGGKENLREGFGLARIETLFNTTVERTNIEGVDGISSKFGRISLKGPLLTNDMRVFDVTTNELNGMADQIAFTLRLRQGWDTLVVDVFLLTPEEVQYVFARAAQQGPRV